MIRVERIKLMKGNLNEVKFGISVSGADVKVDEVRMTIDSGKGFSYVVGAKDVDNGEVVFLFDAVSMGLQEGVDYKGVMEVFVNGQKFDPFECVFEVIEPVKVAVKENKMNVADVVKIEVKPVVQMEKEEVKENKSVTKNRFKFIG